MRETGSLPSPGATSTLRGLGRQTHRPTAAPTRGMTGQLAPGRARCQRGAGSTIAGTGTEANWSRERGAAERRDPVTHTRAHSHPRTHERVRTTASPPLAGSSSLASNRRSQPHLHCCCHVGGLARSAHRLPLSPPPTSPPGGRTRAGRVSRALHEGTGGPRGEGRHGARRFALPGAPPPANTCAARGASRIPPAGR